MKGRLRLTAAFLAAGALPYLYFPTFRWLRWEWLGAGLFPRVTQYWSHGPIVLALIAYLVWRRRAELSASAPSLWGFPLVLGGLGLHWASLGLGAIYLSAYSIIPVSLGLVSQLLGGRAAARLLVPLLLFLLAVPFPVPAETTLFLARLVAASSAFLARLAGMPLLWQGQRVTVGQNSYEIEPLCSGFNLMVSLLALIVPLLYLRRASPLALVSALLWVPALGMATKVALVTTVLALTPRVGQEVALGLYHGWLGILFYLAGLAFALLLLTVGSHWGRIWARWTSPKDPPPEGIPGGHPVLPKR